MQHLDEGTIHAWLDGELSPEEAARAEAHVSECSECRALVAEARGLIAASTRILTALDDVPSGVIPTTASPTADTVTPARMRRWYDRTDFRTAAALLFVAGASLIFAKFGGRHKASLPSAAITAERTGTVVVPLAGTETPQPPPTPSEQKTEVGHAAGGSVKNEAADVARAAPVASRRLDEARALDDASKGLMQPKTLAKSADSAALMQRTAPATLSLAGPVPGRIEGRVTDQLGRGVAQASVIVQGTNLGTTTDTAGRFKIENVPAGEQRVIVRRIGYRMQTVPVSMNDRVATANATMAAETAQLSEAVITGAATSPAVATAGAVKATVQKLETTPLREISVDSTGSVRRTTYEVSPGVRVTLVESSDELARERDLAANKPMARRAAVTAAPPAVVTNTISWVDRNRHYTLTGPLPTNELEAIKVRLMKMRQ
jgi:predicted anti-sigma-YlaC factor YlaD